ncbi:interferon-inducible GTPase 5-like, partial [Paramuricea clavata]
LHDDHELAAETGITETTKIPTPYQHPTNAKIRFWDLPGIGTPDYPDLPTFSEKVGIERFDTFLIICARRFTEYDLQLAEKVQSMGKSFFFVRNKIDNDRRSEKRKYGRKFNEEKMLKEIKNDCVECLENLSCDEEKVFLVSSHAPNEWDFDRLQTAIMDHLPFIQKESLALSLRTHSKVILKEKIKILKGMCNNHIGDSC